MKHLTFKFGFLMAFFFFVAPAWADTTSTLDVNLFVRYQNNLIFSGLVSTTAHDLLADTNGVTHALSSSSSVLTVLYDADALSSDFSISKLDYYDAYSSFYLDCLTLASTSTPVCSNWNYVVNGQYPGVGMDGYALAGGETVYVYYGNSWQVTASTSTFPLGTTTTLSTWRYNYDDLANEWKADGNDTLDVSGSATATLTTDASGVLDYVFATTGTYAVKITSPDYSKWSNAISFSVLAAPTTSTSTESDPPPDGGGGSSGIPPNLLSSSYLEEKAQTVLNYLQSQQSADGKIIDGGTTDWAIMAFGAKNIYADEIKKDKSLLDYAKSYDFSDASDLNVCASYSRHILALLAGGVCTSDALIQTLTEKVKSSVCYSNHKFGQDGINDDVFALLSLLAVDTSASEPIIMDLVSAVTADQTSTGSFTWAGYESADITGAAINALSYAKSKGAAVNQTVFDQAKNYLKNQQLSDGGWGTGTADALTTAWAMMGIKALGEGQVEWAKSSTGETPWSVLAGQMKSNGSYESSWAPGTVDWFATKHVVPALLGKTWPVIMTPKPGQSQPVIVIGSSVETPIATTTLELLPIATSTPEIVTSTVENILPTENIVLVPIPVPVSASVPQVKKAVVMTKVVIQPEAVTTTTVQETIVSVEPAPADPLLPLEKTAAQTAVAGSAVILGGTSLLLLLRLLAAIL